MRMYFVGGFLGSGKTTAIAGACRLLIAQGRRVGVVTNDQGKLQVDSLFMASAGFPTVEVGGGCFCCRYDDFDARVAGLVERERPDAVFAESVGSCADIVATVIKPFEAFRETYGAISVFSVFADSRLLLARLSGTRLPFSEDVLYLFDRQLEEADLLVLNKWDLLGEADRARLASLAAKQWPDKTRLEICGASEEGAAAWLDALGALEAQALDRDHASRIEAGLPGAAPGLHSHSGGPLEIDYGRYGAGERELSWLDQRLVIEDSGGLSSDGGNCRLAILEFALEFALGMAADSLAVGHFKLHVAGGGYEGKISLTAGDFMGSGPGLGRAGLLSLLEAQLPSFQARHTVVAVNARVQARPEELSVLASRAAQAARKATGLAIQASDSSAFRPGLPVPTHRLA